MTSEPPATADFSKVSVRTLIAYVLLGGFCWGLFLCIFIVAKFEAVWLAIMSIVVLYAALLLWALRHCSHAGSDLRHLLGPVPPARDWKPLAALLPLYLQLSGVIMVKGLLFARFLPDFGLSPSPDVVSASLAGRLVLVVLFVLIIPFVEEIVWRGMILRRWAHKWGVYRALIVTSLFFGLIHGDEIFFATLLGLFLGLLYLRSGTIWLPITAHVLWNAQAILNPYQLGNFNNWPAAIAFIVIGSIVLWLMRDIYMPRLPLTLAPLPRSVSSPA